MRKIATAAGLALLLACGSSGSGPSGTNGGINGGVAPSGSSGLTFAPADGLAISVGNTSCTVQGASLNLAALFVEFTSYSGACTFLKTNGLCAGKQSSGTLFLFVANVGVPPLTASAPGPGTYTINSGSATTLAGAVFEEMDASCNDTFTGLPASGTITITSVSPSVKGSVDVTFANGNKVTGDFDVNGCSYSPDVCSVANTAALSGNVCASTGNACLP